MKVPSLIRGILTDRTSKSSLKNVLIKPVSMILGLLYTPLLLDYLGDSKYGLWSTMLSIITWVNYCDVGIGHGLRNLLTKELAEEKLQQAKRTISTAYVILTAISCLLLVTSLICVLNINWFRVFNTGEDMRLPLGISFAFICVNFVLALSNSILYALQKSEMVSILSCTMQCLNIIGVLLLRRFAEPNLVFISILFGGTTTVVYLANTFNIIRRDELRPSVLSFDRSKVAEISNTGVKFFIIQIACIALYTVDNLLITNIFGSEAVTPFNITYRAFNTAYSFLTALCVPFWSRTTDAVARGDIAWIRKSRKNLLYVAAVFIAGFCLLAVIFKPLAGLWLHRKLVYPRGLIWVMCLYYCLYTIVTVNVQLINGTGMINFQLVLMIFMGAANIPFSIFLAKNCRMGIVGIRLATTILMAIGAVAFPINLNRILKRLENRNNVKGRDE